MTWIRKHDRSLFSNATGLLICGLLAGVVVAAAAFPAVAMTGLAAKAGADAFDSLPGVLTVQQSPQITYVYASDGKTLLTTFYDENRRDIPIADVAAVMKEAMVASEDTRFYKHNGVDIKGVARAFVNNQSGGSQQGASTLTMQYVRQAIEYSATNPQEIVDATSDTPGRKIREMHYALALEKQLSKDQILERYLNIAPFGSGAFGIYAAAEVYFGVAPRDLTLGEAALLAGLVQAPTTYDPLDPAGRVKALDRRDNYVLPNMVKMGYITEAQRQDAIKTPLKFVNKVTPNDCISVTNNTWGFFCDYFERWWVQQPAFGADEFERRNRLKSGGYTIVTSLDVKAQSAAVDNINAHMHGLRTSDALMLAGVEPGTGHIQLMAVNRKYSNDQSQNGLSTDPAKRSHGIKGNYPATTIPLISGGGDAVGYQFGSTFKMFTMIAALEQGIPLAWSYNAPKQFVSDYIIQAGSPASCQGNHYCPTNASAGEAGNYNLWTGFGHSVNTFFVPLEQRVGAENAVAVAKDLGVQFRAHGTADNPNDYERANDPDLAHQWGAFTLGVAAVTPLDMANAYATVAADGMYCEPLPVMSIKDFAGTTLDAGNPRCRQAVPVDVARAAADAARCPVGDQSYYHECTGGTAGPTKNAVDKPVAGKTGTTDSDKTAALIAMTKQLAIAGLVADPDYANYSPHYSHNQVNGAVQDTLHDAMDGEPSRNFTPPSRAIAYGTQVSMPSVVCKTKDNAVATLRGAGFTVSVNTTPVPSSCPAGTVARTDPSGRNVKGGSVTVYLSSGAGNPGPNPSNNGPPTAGGQPPHR
ncbi:MAG TPA: transglycosylase domain-containing protein [Rugosimonospora sp.]|nr:transglycosylase domain-containing protein [Rugosimonospora sp.]